MTRPRLALVPGEPAGVGPELCVRALQLRWDADLVVIGDRAALQRAAALLALPLPFDETPGDGTPAGPGL
jgi:4-hydroxythreonine-4-phosphate dehydrogenase